MKSRYQARIRETESRAAQAGTKDSLKRRWKRASRCNFSNIGDDGRCGLTVIGIFKLVFNCGLSERLV